MLGGAAVLGGEVLGGEPRCSAGSRGARRGAAVSAGSRGTRRGGARREPRCSAGAAVLGGEPWCSAVAAPALGLSPGGRTRALARDANPASPRGRHVAHAVLHPACTRRRGKICDPPGTSSRRSLHATTCNLDRTSARCAMARKRAKSRRGNRAITPAHRLQLPRFAVEVLDGINPEIASDPFRSDCV
jgi:hypothetical protein